MEPVAVCLKWQPGDGVIAPRATYALKGARDYSGVSHSVLGGARVMAEGSIALTKCAGKFDFRAIYEVREHTSTHAELLRFSRHDESHSATDEGRCRIAELVTAAQLVIGRQMERDIGAFPAPQDLNAGTYARARRLVYGQFRLEERLELATHFNAVKTLSRLVQFANQPSNGALGVHRVH